MKKYLYQDNIFNRDLKLAQKGMMDKSRKRVCNNKYKINNIVTNCFKVMKQNLLQHWVSQFVILLENKFV